MKDIENDTRATAVAPRRQFTPQDRQAIIEEYEKSTLTPTEFAAQKGIHLTTLYQWQRPRRKLVPTAEGQAQLQEIPLAGILSPTGWAVELISPKGWTIRLRDCAVAELKTLLETSPC